MTMITQDSGCKVGWEWYDDEAEATAAAARESQNRERMFAQGYDFGYQWPGSVEAFENHPKHGKCWRVTTT